MYGDDGDNNGGSNGGGSLTLLCSLRGYIPSLLLKLYEENDMLFFFFLRWVSCTPNSTVGHMSIFTSCLTFSFLSRFRALAPFYFLVSLFFSLSFVFRVFIS